MLATLPHIDVVLELCMENEMHGCVWGNDMGEVRVSCSQILRGFREFVAVMRQALAGDFERKHC